MSTPTAEQIFKIVKDFGLPVVLLLGTAWYLSVMLDDQKEERKEITLFVRTEMADMNKKTTEALTKTTQSLNANTDALEEQSETNRRVCDSLGDMKSVAAELKECGKQMKDHIINQ